jgi:hypothetical protein
MMPVLSSTTPRLGYAGGNCFVKTEIPHRGAPSYLPCFTSSKLRHIMDGGVLTSFRLGPTFPQRFEDLLAIPQHSSRFLSQSISFAIYLRLRYWLIVCVCRTIRFHLFNLPTLIYQAILSFCKTPARYFSSISTIDDLWLLLIRKELIFPQLP